MRCEAHVQNGVTDTIETRLEQLYIRTHGSESNDHSVHALAFASINPPSSLYLIRSLVVCLVRARFPQMSAATFSSSWSGSDAYQLGCFLACAGADGPQSTTGRFVTTVIFCSFSSSM